MHARKAVRLQRLLLACLDAAGVQQQQRGQTATLEGWAGGRQGSNRGLVWSGRQRNRGGDKRGLQASKSWPCVCRWNSSGFLVRIGESDGQRVGMTGSCTYIDRHRLFLIARWALGPFSLRRMRHYIIIIAATKFPWKLEAWQDMGDWGRELSYRRCVQVCAGRACKGVDRARKLQQAKRRDW